MTEPTSAPVGEGVDRLSPVAHRDWRLWVDWCTATDHDPGRVRGQELAAFIADLPATTAIHDRRLRNIRRALGQPAVGLPRPTTRMPTRVGPPWLSYADALAGLRHEWFPEGVAARRDALIVILAAHGFTRPRMRRLQPALVEAFPSFVVDGLALTRHRNPALCAQCALSRWLAVLDAYRHRSGRDVETLLTNARVHASPRHDCLDDLDDAWHSMRWLIPPIDQHGAIVLDRPITGRALTALLTRRFTAQPVQPTSHTPAVVPPHTPGRRPTHQEQNDLARLYDWIDTEADALNARIEALLVGLER